MPEKSHENESESKSTVKNGTESSSARKRRLHLGLDLGTLQSCFVSKLTNLDLMKMLARWCLPLWDILKTGFYLEFYQGTPRCFMVKML